MSYCKSIAELWLATKDDTKVNSFYSQQPLQLLTTPFISLSDMKSFKNIIEDWWKISYPNLEVLYNEYELQNKIKELAAQINEDYKDKDLAVVMIFNGSFIFASDLLRLIKLPLSMYGFSVSSYIGEKSTGELKYDKTNIPNCKDKDVLILDDILDTGLTMEQIKKEFISQGCKSVKVCCLMNNSNNHHKNITADYIGFNIDDAFVVGYGLDIDNKLRNLPFIGILK